MRPVQTSNFHLQLIVYKCNISQIMVPDRPGTMPPLKNTRQPCYAG